jgi:hypothetical protein
MEISISIIEIGSVSIVTLGQAISQWHEKDRPRPK